MQIGWVVGGRAGLLILFLILGTSQFALAQSSPSDIFVDEGAQEEVLFEPLRGFSGYGATVGLMRMHGAKVADGAKLRPVLQSDFRYRFSDEWIGKGEFGFGWNSFDARADTVLAVTFGTLGLQREFRRVLGTTVRFGAGAGMYRWNYKYHGRSVRDVMTQRFSRGFVPGVYLGLESERRTSRHLTISLGLQNHYIMTGADRFQQFFDENLQALTFRIGAHYHFSPYEGIIWERTVNRKIQMTSGKADK